MKFRLILIFSLFALISLAACSSSPAPAVTTEQTSSETQTTPVAPGEAYPAPPDAYPAPAEAYPEPAQQEAAPAQALYPEPQSGDEVTWLQAVAMMYNSEINQILRAQNLELTLNLKDGRSLKALEPNEGALQIVLDDCGELCAGIEVTGP